MNIFKWFKRNKSVKVLVVVNGDTHEPIDYKNKIDVDLKTEVRAACNDLAIEHDDNLINDIAEKLDAGETYWLAEKDATKMNYGFEVLDIKL